MTTTLTDSFGRTTIFTGTELVNESSDNPRKPSWLEVIVWRTEGNSYVALRTTQYRVTHATETCSRAEGYTLVEAGVEDTFNCPACNKNAKPDDPGFAQEDRVQVDSYRTAQALIDSFQTDGGYTNFSRSILAQLAKQDEGVDRAWSVVHVA